MMTSGNISYKVIVGERKILNKLKLLENCKKFVLMVFNIKFLPTRIYRKKERNS